MSAVRLTAGMLTQPYQWHLHADGRGTHSHTERRDLPLKVESRPVAVARRWVPLLISTRWFCFWGESWSTTPCPFFLLGLTACQTHVIQEIPLLGPSRVTIATGIRTCRCRPSLRLAPVHMLARSLAPVLYCTEAFVATVGGIIQVSRCCPEVILYFCFSCCKETCLQTHRFLREKLKIISSSGITYRFGIWLSSLQFLLF